MTTHPTPKGADALALVALADEIDRDVAEAIHYGYVTSVAKGWGARLRALASPEAASEARPMPSCLHESTTIGYEAHTCDACGFVRVGYTDWGIAAHRWFPSIKAAKHYRDFGTLPDGTPEPWTRDEIFAMQGRAKSNATPMPVAAVSEPPSAPAEGRAMDAAEVMKFLADATPGALESDSIKGDGAMYYALYSTHGKVIADTLNSEVACIHDDADSPCKWDDVGRNDTIALAACWNYMRKYGTALASAPEGVTEGEVEGTDLYAIADKLVKDWGAAGKMQPRAWDFRGFAMDAMQRYAAALSTLTRRAPTARDGERLDALELFVKTNGGLVIHNGDHGGGKYAGLGLASTKRTLRQALDQSVVIDAAQSADGGGEG